MRQWFGVAAWVIVSILVLVAGGPGRAEELGAFPTQSGTGDEAKPAAVIAAPTKSDFEAAADYSAKHGGRAVLVMHKGEMVFERYDRGWTAERPHPLASGTKSFTGVMAMLAVQDGLLTLDELASDTITEWKSDPLKSRITVRHLLTLSSGLDPSDATFAGGSGSRLLGEAAERRSARLGLNERRGRPENNFTAAVNVKMSGEPGQQFEYGSSHFFAFGELLQRKLKAKNGPQTNVLDYLRVRVLNPVGIEPARIGRDRAGNPNLPGGMLLTAREWAKFGAFVLDDGSVRQADGAMKSILKPELLAECFKPSAKNPTYGLTWWLPGAGGDVQDADGGGGLRARVRNQMAQNRAVIGPDGKPLTVYMAAGLGKQRLYVLPDLDLVVIRFAEGTTEGARFNDAEFLGPILGVK